jgi:hypothetical protein
MSRRRSSQHDSLELLLDTICNTFGGVLFIAILVVLLLQQTGTSPASATVAAKPLTNEEIQSLTIRMETVAEQLIRMQQNRESQDAIVQSFAPDEIRQLLVSRSDAASRQEALELQVNQLLATNTGLVAKAERLSDENRTVRVRFAEMQEREQSAQKQLDDDRRSRTQEVRLPVLRKQWGKTEIGFMLRYGRLYLWHDYEPGPIRRGLNTKDFVVIAEEAGKLVTRPNPTRGIVLNDGESSKEDVRQILRKFDPKSCYLGIIARPDSYGAFRHVRDRAIELGFEYRLLPAGADEPVADRGGIGNDVQ